MTAILSSRLFSCHPKHPLGPWLFSPTKPCQTPPSGTNLFLRDLVSLVSLILFRWVKSTPIVCVVHSPTPAALKGKWHPSYFWVSSTRPKGSKTSYINLQCHLAPWYAFFFRRCSVVRSFPPTPPPTTLDTLFWIWQPSEDELSARKVNFCFSAGSHGFPLGLKVLLFG